MAERTTRVMLEEEKKKKEKERKPVHTIGSDANHLHPTPYHEIKCHCKIVDFLHLLLWSEVMSGKFLQYSENI
jgi:hypothetical protein